MGDPTFDEDLIALERFARLDGTVSAQLIHRVASRARQIRGDLVEMVNQHCAQKDGTLYAMGLSTNRDAMMTLAEVGLVKITGGVGRCIKGEWDGPMRQGVTEHG